MSKLTDIYSRLKDITVDDLCHEDRELIEYNEGYIQEMLSEFGRTCRRFQKMGVEFDMDITFRTTDNGSLQTKYHNNLIERI